MIDFANLYQSIEMHRAENQNFSYPFVVQCEDRKVISWFSYKVSGRDEEHLYTHIHSVYVMNEENDIKKQQVVLDVPFAFSDQKQADYSAYLCDLERVYNDFSEEKMNELLQNSAYKPLFKAFQCVRSYVRTHQ